MRIDAHQHFWEYDPGRDAWITDEMSALQRDFLPDDLAPHLKAAGIQGTVAVQADQSERETAFLLDLAERHPFIRAVVGWVDLRAVNLADRLEHFSRYARFRGVRHVAQAEADDFLARDDVVQGIGRLREFGLTYDLLVYPRQLPAALALVERLPDQPFVVDHLAKPPVREQTREPWSEQMRALAAHPNVYCKVSGLVTEADWVRWRASDFAPYLDVVLDAFGAHRLMVGSDWPVCRLAATYRQVIDVVEDWAALLAPSERAALFGGTARRFYGIEDHPSP